MLCYDDCSFQLSLAKRFNFTSRVVKKWLSGLGVGDALFLASSETSPCKLPEEVLTLHCIQELPSQWGINDKKRQILINKFDYSVLLCFIYPKVLAGSTGYNCILC